MDGPSPVLKTYLTFLSHFSHLCACVVFLLALLSRNRYWCSVKDRLWVVLFVCLFCGGCGFLFWFSLGFLLFFCCCCFVLLFCFCQVLIWYHAKCNTNFSRGEGHCVQNGNFPQTVSLLKFITSKKIMLGFRFL